MKRINILGAMLGVVASLIMAQASAVIMPNTTLYDGSPGFSLSGATEFSDTGLPAVQFITGFNAQSPTASTGPTLDLGNANVPLINNPDTGSSFSLFWGMDLPAVQFVLPSDVDGVLYPPSPCLTDILNTGSYCYNFDASDAVNIFHISFMFTGPTGATLSNWTAVPNPGPPGLPAVQFNFDFADTTLLAGDPLLSFSVSEDGLPMRFSVPEPGTVSLMVVGLLGLVTRRRTSTG